MSKLIGRCREAKEKLLFFYSCKSHKLSLLLCNSLVHWETRLLYKNVKFILQCKRTAFGVFFFLDTAGRKTSLSLSAFGVCCILTAVTTQEPQGKQKFLLPL